MSGMLPPTIAFLLGNIEDFKLKMSEAEAKSAETDAKIGESGKLGAKAFMAVGAAVAGVAYESLKLAVQFDATMTRINSQDNAGLTTRQMKDLKTSVLDLAGPTAQAPEALAEAMIHVYGSGLKGAAALDLLKVAAEGATIGHANLVDVTNALDAAVAVGIKGTGDYNAAMGELNATVGAGDMTMQNLAEALGGPMLATVKGYGLNITDVGAALAVFGDRNIRGAEAATGLRLATQALAVPAAAPAAARALEGIGLATTSLRDDLQKGGLKLALNDLNDHLLRAGYNSTTAGALITTAFGKKAGGGLNVLMDSLASSTSNFNDKFQTVAESGKTFATNWAQTQDTLAYKIKALGTGLEALGIKFGTALIPYVSEAIGWMQKFGTGVHDALDSPAGRQAAAMLGNVWRDLVFFMKDAATTAGELGRAIEPTAVLIGGLLLGGLRVVAAILSDVVGPALKAFGGFLKDNSTLIEIFAGVVLGGLIAKLLYLKTLAAIDMFTTFVTGIGAAITQVGAFTKALMSGQIFDTLRLKAMYAGDAVQGLAGKMKGAAVEAEGAAASTGGWATKLGGSLPIIGAVLVGVGYLSSKLGEMSGVGDHTALSIDKLNTSMLGITTGSPQTRTALVDLGAALADMDQKMGGGIQGLKDYDKSLANLVASGHAGDADAIIGDLAAKTDKHGTALINITRDFPQYAAALDAAKLKAKEAATATDGAAGSLTNLKPPLDAATTAALATSDAITAVSDAFTTLTTNLKASKALDAFQADLRHVTDEITKNGKALWGNTDAAEANRNAFRKGVDDLMANREAQIKNLTATEGGTQAVLDANKTAADQATQLIKVWEQTTGNKKAVDAYALSIGLIPKDMYTAVSIDTTAALAKLQQLNDQMMATGGSGHSKGGGRIGYGGGGPVTGPGTSTSDSIPAMLSAGEYVIDAAAASKVPRALLDALNAGDLNRASAVLGGGMPTGGPSFAGGSFGGGGGDTVVNVYVQDPGQPGWRTASNTRTEVLRYNQRNSRNNWSLTGTGG